MNKYLQIIFADAKTTAERAVCVISALFWTWLTFLFLQFFFNFGFGIYHSIYGIYPEAILMMMQSRTFTTPLIWVVCLFIFFTRIPLYKRREIKEKIKVPLKEKIKVPLKNKIMQRYMDTITNNLNLNGGQLDMPKISEFVDKYEPQQTTKNIADLKEVSIDLEVEDDDYEIIDKGTQQPKIINQKVIIVNGEKYRIPVSVIQQLKIIREDNPNLKKFKVKKSGTTKDDTRYQVIPLV